MIESKEQTCGGCPSQWEGKLADGRMFYIRYRWGCLSIRVSDGVTNDAVDAIGGKEVYRKQIGGGMDGVIAWDEIPKEGLEKL